MKTTIFNTFDSSGLSACCSFNVSSGFGMFKSKRVFTESLFSESGSQKCLFLKII